MTSYIVLSSCFLLTNPDLWVIFLPQIKMKKDKILELTEIDILKPRELF